MIALCNPVAIQPEVSIPFKENIEVYNVPNNDASSVFVDTTNIVWDTTRGYYRSINNWSEPAVDFIIPNLSDIQKITATIYGYYNTPSGGLAYNILKVTYDDASTALIGTADAWTHASNGQTIYKGDSGTETKVQRDVVGETYSIVVPSGRTVDSIDFDSRYLSGYAESNRGIRDIIVQYKIRDKSINNYTLTNNNLESTTGQFGEPGGAFLWNSTTDYLSLSSAVGDVIRAAINNNACTVSFFLYVEDTDFSTGRLFSQWGNSGNRSFRVSYNAISGASNDSIAITNSTNGIDNTDNAGSPSPTEAMRGQWNFIQVIYDGDGTVYVDETLNVSIPSYSTLYNSSAEFRIGADNSSVNNSFYGKMHTFNVHLTKLNLGELNTLRLQQGRIVY